MAIACMKYPSQPWVTAAEAQWGQGLSHLMLEPESGTASCWHAAPFYMLPQKALASLPFPEASVLVQASVSKVSK